MTEQQKRALTDYQVQRIVAANISDALDREQKLHDFEGGFVVIHLSVELEKDTRYSVIHIAEDGSVEELESTHGENYIEFTTGHFSSFAVVRIDDVEETAAMETETSKTEETEQTEADGEAQNGGQKVSEGGDGWIVIGIIAAIFIMLVIAAVIWRRHRRDAAL